MGTAVLGQLSELEEAIRAMADPNASLTLPAASVTDGFAELLSLGANSS
jgi:hypothetical protein